MNSPDITNAQLKTLAEQNTIINNVYYNDRLQKLGLQENLGEVYKPLLTSSKNLEDRIDDSSKNIIDKIEQQPQKLKVIDRLDEIKTLLENFPNVIAHLTGDKTKPLSETNKATNEIIDKLDEEEMRGLLRILNEGEILKKFLKHLKKVMLKKLTELEMMKILKKSS
jgi:hypothetical protein